MEQTKVLAVKPFEILSKDFCWQRSDFFVHKVMITKAHGQFWPIRPVGVVVKEYIVFSLKLHYFVPVILFVIKPAPEERCPP